MFTVYYHYKDIKHFKSLGSDGKNNTRDFHGSELMNENN